MDPKISQFINKGMQQDYSVSKSSNEFAFKNHNIRITTRGENSLLTVTNEKGNELVKFITNYELKAYKEEGVYKKIMFDDPLFISTIKVICRDGVLGSMEYTYLYNETKDVFDLANNIVEIYGIEVTIKGKLYTTTKTESNSTYDFYNINNALLGTNLGACVSSNSVVLFQKHSSNDYIELLQLDDNKSFSLKTLYCGDLGFSLDYPIETLYNYESENVEKVYWVDGKNQPRVINIKGNIKENNNSQFDFNPTIYSDLKVSITKQNFGGGTFLPGVIQYIVTYYNDYGQESSPVYISPLYYLSNSERGSNIEDTVSCSFTIKCEFLDSSWDNIVLYSIHRSTLNSTALGYKVGEFNIKNTQEDLEVTFIDNGTHLETIDPTKFYFESDEFIPSTLAAKSDKLFFGNINSVDTNDLTFALKDEKKVDVHFESREVEYPNYGGLYDYKFQLNEDESKIKTFKGGETYRFALQLQNNKGVWSSPIYLDDIQNTKYPKVIGSTVRLPYVKVSIPYDKLENNIPDFKNYNKARILMAEPTNADRSVLAQGILSPTVYNLNEAVSNNCNNANSWIQRFTTLDKHLNNVNDKAFGEGFIGTPSLVELPVEKKEGKFDIINYDIINDDSEDNVTTTSKKANLKSITYKLHQSSANDGSSKYIVLELSLKDCVFDIYNTKGLLEETRTIDLSDVWGANNDYYHFSSAFVLKKDFIAGGHITKVIKSKLKNHSEHAFTLIKAYLSQVTFLSDHKIDKEKKSLYHILRDKLGNNIELLNIKKEDSVLDESAYKNLNFDKIFSLIEAKKFQYEETTEIKTNFKLIPTSKLQATRITSRNQYFVDANVVSFYSPDLDNIVTDDVKFRIVGCAKLRHNISEYKLAINNPNGRNMLLDFNKSNKKGRYLRSHFLYHLTTVYTTPYEEKEETKYKDSGSGAALLSLWQKSGSLSNNNEENILKRKVVGNLWYCDTNYYADEGLHRILWETEDITFKKALDPIISLDSKIYKKDYENLLLPITTFEHMVKLGASPFDSLEKLDKEGIGSVYTFADATFNGCLIKYSSENHGVIKLSKDLILPGFKPTITGIEIPTRLSTGELLIPQQDKRFLPYPLQYMVEEIPKMYSEIPKITISIKGGDNGNQYILVKDCYCPVLFWTPTELSEYLTDIGEYSNLEGVKKALNKNNLIPQKEDYVGNIASDFLKSLLYKTDKGKLILRTAIYCNTDATLDSDANDSGVFEIYGNMLSESSFKSTYKNVSVYPYNLSTFDIKSKLGIKTNNHTNNCKAEIVDNLPVFIYNKVLQIVSEDSDKFKYEITDDFWNRIPSVWIGELYRDVPNAYGGKDNLSISNTKYIVCGEAFDLDHDVEDTTQEVVFKGTIGDTYFQRWDCLRTYPTTEEDVNSIIDVTSTMLETHINLDGRTDNTRGRLDVTNIRPFNINNINKVYSQSNNFFTYHSVDKRLVNNKIENCYTWSLSKVNGELIDSWTKGLMVNVNNVDGSKGKITKLQLWRDYLLCFQETGIARIHYNDQTTISSLEGVPIEILNSQTVAGHNYLSEAVGCHNKWSISPTESGIYFVDSINKSINIFNGEIINLSYNKSFKDWGTNNLNDIVWSPNNLKGYKASFDFKNRDYYLTNSDNCLCFSEELQSFASFYDYTESPTMFNIKDLFVGLQYKDDTTYLWNQFANDDYCSFYGEQKDYYVEFNVNPNPLQDKIFTNLEYRAYVDNSDDTFDNIEVSNEYQYGSCNPNKNRFKYPNAEKKFRIWRLDIPRDSNSRKGLDRIRNPWMKLKLTKSTNTNNRMNFHDLLVKYYE